MAKMNLADFRWKPILDIARSTPDVHAADALFREYPAAWGIWCKFMWVTTVSSQIENCVSIIHGPLGCLASTRKFHEHFFEKHYGIPFFHMPSTNMKSHQVILGGEENLEKAVFQIDRDYRSSLIIVHTNCCSGLNMDHVPGVLERIQPDVKAKVHFIPSPGFESCWPGDVMESITPHYVGLIEKPREIDKKAVNIVGVNKDMYVRRGIECRTHSPSNPDEIARYIEILGLKVHSILIGGSYESIRRASEAVLNVIDCPAWGYPIAKAMEKRFGTPSLEHGRNIGVECTMQWIRELASKMDVEDRAEEFIGREYKTIKDTWERAKEIAHGKVALIEGVRAALVAVTRPLAQARFAMELGMTPYMFNITPPAIKSKEYIVEYFAKHGVNPMTLDGPYPYQNCVNAQDVIEMLGVCSEDVVYFTNDVFNQVEAGYFDPSCVAKVDSTGQPYRRLRGRPRDFGFRAAEGMARDVINGIKAAKRKTKPTFYGRLY